MEVVFVSVVVSPFIVVETTSVVVITEDVWTVVLEEGLLLMTVVFSVVADLLMGPFSGIEDLLGTDL